MPMTTVVRKPINLTTKKQKKKAKLLSAECGVMYDMLYCLLIVAARVGKVFIAILACTTSCSSKPFISFIVGMGRRRKNLQINKRFI